MDPESYARLRLVVLNAFVSVCFGFDLPLSSHPPFDVVACSHGFSHLPLPCLFAVFVCCLISLFLLLSPIALYPRPLSVLYACSAVYLPVASLRSPLPALSPSEVTDAVLHRLSSPVSNFSTHKSSSRMNEILSHSELLECPASFNLMGSSIFCRLNVASSSSSYRPFSYNCRVDTTVRFCCTFVHP